MGVSLASPERMLLSTSSSRNHVLFLSEAVEPLRLLHLLAPAVPACTSCCASSVFCCPPHQTSSDYSFEKSSLQANPKQPGPASPMLSCILPSDVQRMQHQSSSPAPCQHQLAADGVHPSSKQRSARARPGIDLHDELIAADTDSRGCCSSALLHDSQSTTIQAIASSANRQTDGRTTVAPAVAARLLP